MSELAKNIDVLYDAATIARRIDELGAKITADYHGEQLIVVGILKGSFVFMSDLVRRIDLPLRCEFMGVSSYGDDTQSSGVVRVTHDLTEPIKDANVLIVEDIIDTGLTVRYLLDAFTTRHPRSVRVCTLLHKPENARIKVPIDYVGFTIPNRFVVGYGLDHASIYRNLPFIGVYRG
jgi:hypoxanthine phosphoribosyltransferase